MVKRDVAKPETRGAKDKKIVFIQTNYPDFLDCFYRKNPDWISLDYEGVKSKLLGDEIFGSADFYGRALKKFGWISVELIVNDFNQQSLWAKENGLSVKKGPSLLRWVPGRYKGIFGLNNWIKKIVFSQIKKIQPKVLYIHDLNIFNKNDIRIFKSWGIRVVGQIAYPLPLDMESLREYDLIVSSFRHYVKLFRSMGIKSAYLRWCFEKDVIKKVKPKKIRKIDVSFVGGFSPHHSNGNKVLEDLAREVKVDFWGYGINFLMPGSPIRKTYHGQAFGKEMYKIFANSKIVVNRHIGVSGKSANNMRMFEATGMGALLITDAKKNMDEFFEVGKEVLTYKNSKELITTVKDYLKRDDAREQIAKRGQKKTLKEHTYSVRMAELNNILLEFV